MSGATSVLTSFNERLEHMTSIIHPPDNGE